jgi:hypothetical protein
MSAAIGLRDDFTAADLRRLVGKVRDADQVRRLLALAAVYDGMDRSMAAPVRPHGVAFSTNSAASNLLPAASGLP